MVQQTMSDYIVIGDLDTARAEILGDNQYLILHQHLGSQTGRFCVQGKVPQKIHGFVSFNRLIDIIDIYRLRNASDI